MATLREYIGNIGEKYIWGLSKEDEPTKSKVKHMGSSSTRTRELVESGNLEMLRKIVLSEPLVRKAIFKKNRDTFKNWFVIKDKNGEIIPDNIYKVIKKFDKRTRFPSLLFTTGVCSNIYGTGFIEKIYNENLNTSSMTKITNRKNLIDLELLNPENIKERKNNPENPNDLTLYPVYRRKNSTEEKLIHPTRLEVIRIDYLPFSYFGISVPRVLWNILNSKMNGDVSSGELLNWFGRGMFDITIDGMTDEDKTITEREVKKHPDYLIHDEKVETNVVNPTRIDPTPFYDYFYTNIAAALEMPKHMLTGAEIGNVTGSEVGISAYYSDIENIQKLVFTPIIENIYAELLESHNKKWEYDIVWNPIFVDELSEARILQTRAYSASQSVTTGIVDIPEARRMLNQGLQELDVDKIPKDKPKPKDDVVDPNIEPQPVIKKESRYVPFLTKSQQEMIEKTKLKGKIEEILQEKRLKEAEGRLKK